MTDEEYHALLDTLKKLHAEYEARVFALFDKLDAGEMTEAEVAAAHGALYDAADPRILDIVKYALWDAEPVIFSDREAWYLVDDGTMWFETNPIYPSREAGPMTAEQFADCFGALPRLPRDAFRGWPVLPKTNGRFAKVRRLPPHYYGHSAAYWEEKAQRELEEKNKS